MESRWYLFPGQTLENTNISDRQHALHITSKAWAGITKHLDRKKLIQEAIDKEIAHRKALKEGSEAMTRNWDNSVENIRRRKEEAREKRIGFQDIDKLKKYYELREEQEAERDELVHKVKLEMFREKGYCKDLTSALLNSEVLYERDKQVEFQEMIKQHEKEEDKKYAEKVKKGAEDEIREKEELEKKQWEEKIELGKMLRKEMRELEEMKKAEKERLAKKETEDNILAAKELEEIKRNEEEEKRKRKQFMKMQQKQALEKRKKDREIREKEDKEMEEVVNLYAETKHRIDCIRKEKEKELQQAFMARVEAVSKLQAAEEKPKEIPGENLLQKRIDEHQTKDDGKREQEKKMRIEDYEQYLRRMEKEKKKEEEIKKWEILNRYKLDDLTKVHGKEEKAREWANMIQYRKDLLSQIEEEEKLKKQEEEQLKREHEAAMEALKEEDKMFFEYAEEVTDHAKKKGRPLYPIEKVVLEYKRDNDLLPKNGRHICEQRKPKQHGKKVWDDEKHMSLLRAGYLKCKCCKKYFKEKMNDDEDNNNK